MNGDSNNPKVCENCGSGCKCPHHVVAPVAIILIGVAFLLQTFDVISWNTVAIAWPVLLIIAAATKLCSCCGRCK